MKNFELYEKEVKSILNENESEIGINKITGRPVKCEKIRCEDCLFQCNGHCPALFIKWLYEEHNESEEHEKRKDIKRNIKIRYSMIRNLIEFEFLETKKLIERMEKDPLFYTDCLTDDEYEYECSHNEIYYAARIFEKKICKYLSKNYPNQYCVENYNGVRISNVEMVRKQYKNPEDYIKKHLITENYKCED